MDASWGRPDGELCNWLFKKCWFSFLNKATSGWCCPSVRTVALMLHAIPIIKTSFRTVLPWRPDGCNSSSCLALSRIASEQLQLPFHICVSEGNHFTCRTLNSVQMVLLRRPDGCTWTQNSFGTLKSVRTCCWDVRTDASLNNRHWWESRCMTGPSGRKLGIRFFLSWKLYRIFFEL
jgi:hypothetical protein